MTNSQRLATVRAFLKNWIASADGNKASADSDASEGGWTESLLIREGFFCGRSFVTKHHRAVWFVEEDELKIRDQSGEIVAVFRGEEITSVETVHSSDVGEPSVIKIDTDDSDDEPIRRAA